MEDADGAVDTEVKVEIDIAEKPVPLYLTDLCTGEKSVLKNYTKVGPKRGRGRGAAKMSQRGTGRGQVAKRTRSPTPSPSEDEAMLVSEPEQPQSHPAGGDHPDITAAAGKKRKNKPYYYTTLTDSQKEEVIDWLKNNPSIYSKRLTDFKDLHKKEKLWEDKAADMGVEVADLKTFYNSNRTKMTRIKRTVGKSGDGVETAVGLSATDNWVWEKFSFIKDHIETVERRNRGRGRGTPATAIAPGPAVPSPAEDIIQSDSGAESQSTEPSSRRLSTEIGDLRRNLMEFMSGSKGGPSTLVRHIGEGLAQLPGDIKRATEIKLMEVLHEGQRQAEERQEMLQQMPIFPQFQSYLPSSTSITKDVRADRAVPAWTQHTAEGDAVADRHSDIVVKTEAGEDQPGLLHDCNHDTTGTGKCLPAPNSEGKEGWGTRKPGESEHNEYPSVPEQSVEDLKTRDKNPERPHACPLCPATYKRPGHLREHMSKHKGEKNYACAKCDDKFRTIRNLKHHMRIHSGQRPHTCPHCDATFVLPNNLSHHKRKVHPATLYGYSSAAELNVAVADSVRTIDRTLEKPHTCHLCPAAYKQANHLMEHMFKHTGEKAHACVKCDEAFSLPQHLKRHLLSHTGQRPYKCQHCDASFMRPHYLTRHIRVGHPKLSDHPSATEVSVGVESSTSSSNSNLDSPATEVNTCQNEVSSTECNRAVVVKLEPGIDM